MGADVGDTSSAGFDLTDLRSLPLIYVDDLDHPVLSEADQHHYERVRRLAPGTLIVLSDAKGRARRARFASAPTDLEPVIFAPLRPTPITVGFAPVKGERPEWVVQKLTELGVDRIVPLQTDRSVVRWDERRAAKQVTKWRSVSREAGMQSRQLRLPRIDEVTPLRSVEVASAVLADPSGRALRSGDHTILVGPEGGWSDEELERAPSVALPGGVLRAETAAIVAGTLAVASAGSQPNF